MPGSICAGQDKVNSLSVNVWIVFSFVGLPTARYSSFCGVETSRNFLLLRSVIVADDSQLLILSLPLRLETGSSFIICS